MNTLKPHPKQTLSDKDKPWRSFLILSFILMSFFVLTFTILTILYFNPVSLIRNMIELALIALTGILTICLICILIALMHVYNTGVINSALYPFTWMGFHYLLPFLIGFSKHLKGHKNSLLLFYLKLNNIFVKSKNKKYLPANILIILPHCLQNTSCPYKVTGLISNCRKCMKCNIGDVLLITEKYHIPSLEVVTGGTSARSVVSKRNPELIIAVACERDLAAGIGDIKGIPVIGILNIRPNGPCINTRIDMEEFSQTLESILGY